MVEVDCSNEREDGFCLLDFGDGNSIAMERGNLRTLGVKHGDRLAIRRVEPEPEAKAVRPWTPDEMRDIDAAIDALLAIRRGNALRAKSEPRDPGGDDE